MKFTMNSQDLLEGLTIVTRALAPRAPKQILEGVMITATENRVHMTCSDGSLTIRYSNSASISEEGKTVLPGRLFTELIRKMPTGEISISISDEHSAIIRCMRNRSSISVMNYIEYPEMQSLKGGYLVRIPQNRLKEMISHVTFAIATDENRQILTGSLLEVSHSEARMVALDGFRLSMQKIFQPFELPEGIDLVSPVIPGKVLTELSRILPDDEAFCDIYLDGRRMYCSFGNIELCCGLLSGEYIDYRKILPTSFKSEVRAKKSDVEEAIDRAGLMAREGKNNLIRISIRRESLKISSNAEMGNVEEEVEATLNGDQLDIAFNARYLADVIRNVTEEEIIMRFNSSVSPCVIIPQSGDNYLYLILPVRVFQ